MEGGSILYKTDNTTVGLSPAGSKFTKEELELAVGGKFLLIPCNDNERFFVVNKEIKSSPNSLDYNINANYLYRRYVDKDRVLRGDVLLCQRDLLELTHIIFFSGSIDLPEGAEEQDDPA